jgi:hypothetical protein
MVSSSGLRNVRGGRIDKKNQGAAASWRGCVSKKLKKW